MSQHKSAAVRTITITAKEKIKINFLTYKQRAIKKAIESVL